MTPPLTSLTLLVTFLGVFPLDVILPSFPALAVEFNTSTQSIAYSVTLFILAVSASQIIIGPLSDALGRKRLLVIGLLASASGAAGCLLSDSFEVFLLFRLLQALGCGCFVLTHALVQDLYGGKIEITCESC
ncbi:MFS transporter [Pseudomonas sp. SWRI107]|uniref:MFS transporter n=1 Tax=Pseudomonas farsensis TaxID=2745492 RepID=UPI001C3D5D0D|nr:MFS transporter [Pseudomonas farsensis]